MPKTHYELVDEANELTSDGSNAKANKEPKDLMYRQVM